MVRIKKPRVPQELDYDDEVAILNQLLKMTNSRNQSQADEYGEGSFDYIQNELVSPMAIVFA